MIDETVTLSEAKTLIKALAGKESLLLLSPPGIGKSDIVRQAAKEAGLEVRSLLGTQIAPEDVSGIPKIVNERAVFCPPRVLLPEDPKPFCLFLDEFPAAAPDVQKALYALLHERRIGEHKLPEGTWVVAAGNRQQDRALVRQISSALVNRTFILNIQADVNEWLVWAEQNKIRRDIISFISFSPNSLMREVPSEPLPFSTPRAWVSLSNALNLCMEKEILDSRLLKGLTFGRVSAEDAAVFSAIFEAKVYDLHKLEDYIRNPNLLPKDSGLWFILHGIRNALESGSFTENTFSEAEINNFFNSISKECMFALLTGNVEKWGRLGADDVFLNALKEATGLGK